MMITLHHGSMDNWFVLGDRDGGRINGADIEGSRKEWAAIADALERQESISFKRCAAHRQPDGTWALSSPRNSISATVVSERDAKSIAAEIRLVLALTPVDVVQAEDEPSEQT